MPKFEVVTPIIHDWHWEVEAENEEEAVRLANKTPVDMLDRVSYIRQEVARRQNLYRSEALKAYIAKKISD